MTPIFKCLICRKDIERSTKSFWTKKGHLLCSSCLDKIEDKKSPHLNKKDQYNLEKIQTLSKNLLSDKNN